jgi:hypothetical protein
MDDKICMGCEGEEDSKMMFKGTFYDKEKDEYVEEYYCNICIANIMTEEPELCMDLEAL